MYSNYYVQEAHDVDNNREYFGSLAEAKGQAKLRSTWTLGEYDVCAAYDHGAVVASYRNGMLLDAGAGTQC